MPMRFTVRESFEMLCEISASGDRIPKAVDDFYAKLYWAMEGHLEDFDDRDPQASATALEKLRGEIQSGGEVECDMEPQERSVVLRFMEARF